MAINPLDEDPGFETDVNELPDDENGSEDTLEDGPREAVTDDCASSPKKGRISTEN